MVENGSQRETKFTVDPMLRVGAMGLPVTKLATCDKAGHVVYWDNHNCAANQMLHTLKPKTPPSTPLGCSYQGKWYPAGADIYRGYNDGQCYGANCDKNGKVQLWESSSCTLGPNASPA